MSETLDLFDSEAGGPKKQEPYRPLADRLRPDRWEDFQGLEKLDKNLIQQLQTGRGNPPSLVLWGPPGSGKTTFAKLVGRSYHCRFIEFSAVLGGVKEVREIVAAAQKASARTILFVDEIHRFNKGQQDAFLPHVERGTIVLIGATTENPSFYLTGALLSRVKVLTFGGLSEAHLRRIAQGAANDLALSFSEEALGILCSIVGGDARRLLNFIEGFREAHPEQRDEVSGAALRAFLRDAGSKFYDRAGEEHYNTISAFIKSLRGSDPDAALFYAFWMMEAGEDPRFLIRRMMVFASEDIGNADPRALQVAVATSEAFEKLGLPEGRIPIAQCITYLACAPKSNRSYMAMHAAVQAVGEHSKIEVPMHLRNAPTSLMKELGYHKGYQYPHDLPAGYVPEVEYLPKELAGTKFYTPSPHGYEKTIAERMRYWKSLKEEQGE